MTGLIHAASGLRYDRPDHNQKADTPIYGGMRKNAMAVASMGIGLIAIEDDESSA
jgi:hypothetical protein